MRKAIEEQGNLTEEISKALDEAVTLTEIEDIYRPYRPKRRTRATIAKEKGLDALAEAIYAQDENMDYHDFAASFINEEKGVLTSDDAINGALDIIAETVSDDAEGRKRIRYVCFHNGYIRCVGIKRTWEYMKCADRLEPISRVPGHRILP